MLIFSCHADTGFATHYLEKRDDSTYYGNLDNNAGVLHRVMDDAEEQDLRECLLVFFLLWKLAPREGWDSETLDRHAEQMLCRWIGADIDFDVEDALGSLAELELVHCDANHRWRCLGIDDAIARLGSLAQTAGPR